MTAPDGSDGYLNQQGLNYTGRDDDAEERSDWFGLVHPDDLVRAQQAWSHATRTLSKFELDYRIRRFDGEYRWHAFRGGPIRDEQGVIVKWLGTATDVDEERRSSATRRLVDRESAEALTLLETVISNAPFGFGFIDRDFRILRLNEVLAAVNGLPIADTWGSASSIWFRTFGRYSNRSTAGSSTATKR